jgi:hypothetical protein
MRQVAMAPGVPFIGPGDEPRGRAALNGSVQSSSLPSVSKFKGERK